MFCFFVRKNSGISKIVLFKIFFAYNNMSSRLKISEFFHKQELESYFFFKNTCSFCKNMLE